MTMNKFVKHKQGVGIMTPSGDLEIIEMRVDTSEGIKIFRPKDGPIKAKSGADVSFPPPFDKVIVDGIKHEVES